MNFAVNSNQLLQQALTAHQNGHFGQAEQLYKQVLHIDPKQADALHLLGVLAYQQGQFAPAIEWIQQALQVAPNTPHFHSNLANALKDAGQTEAAIAHYHKALQLEPRTPEIHNNLGTALQDQGQYEEAIKCYRKALSYQADYAEAHYNLGGAFTHIGQPEAALKHLKKAWELAPQAATAWQIYQQKLAAGNKSDAQCWLAKALELNPHHRSALKAQANYLFEEQQWSKALPIYQQLVAMSPSEAEILYNLGQVCMQLSQPSEAVDAFVHALSIEPENALIHYSLGTAYAPQGLFAEAKRAYQRATELNPQLVFPWRNLGNLCEQMDHFEESLSYQEQALAVDPHDAENWFNRGAILQKLARYAQATQDYQQALLLNPHLVKGQYNLGFCQLIQGQYPEGFASYEWRWQMVDDALKQQMLERRWDGEPLVRKTLWLQAEQGLGDTLQFVRYLPWIVERLGESNHIMFSLPAALCDILTPLAQQTGVELITTDKIPAFDVQIPLMSVPVIAQTTLESVPWSGPYLRQVDPWPLPAGKPSAHIKIGVAWAGNPENRLNPYRSCPLSALKPLFQLPTVQCYALQKDIGPEEQACLVAWGVVDLSTQLTDFKATAHYLAALDLVLSIDTSLIHLAGALGHPAWLLLSTYHDWRWMAEGAHSPWYPDIRIFRQAQRHQWEPVIAAIIETLAAYPKQV